MANLSREDLYSLEEYARIRSEFRAKVMEHKRDRSVTVGESATLFFEDRLTMQYQVQEMLRAERIFESAEIDEELAAYNPLIPDGSNWKVTFMLQYPDPDIRKEELSKLIGIEDKIWVQVHGFDKVYAIADEDLERETSEKTSSVHFLRFELNSDMVAAAKSGAAVNVGIDHPAYTEQATVTDNVRASLVSDLH
jgi:hypothetical protein